MSKTLYLVRHAKSSWVNPSYSDFDRPLDDRGRLDAPEIGTRLKNRAALPDTIICSPARRACETLELLNSKLGVDPDSIFMQKRIYEASTETLLQLVRTLDDSRNSAMIIGHNPAMSALASGLTEHPLDNMPTCAVAAIQLASNGWNDAGIASGELIFFDYPENRG